MQAQAEEAALLFGGSKDGVLTRSEAVDALSAMGVAVRDADAEAMITKDITPPELAQIATKLQTKNFTRDELVKLINDLNPNSKGTISKGTLLYILKSNHNVPDEQLEAFINHMNLPEQNGMVQADAVVNALLAVLI